MKLAFFLITALVLAHASAVAGATPKAPAGDADKPGTISGIAIPRPNGNFLGIEIVDTHFKLTFYDAKKKPVAPDLARAILRWPVHYQPNDERTILSADSDGTSLSSEKSIRAPHEFKLFISLFAEGAENAAETYVVDFHE